MSKLTPLDAAFLAVETQATPAHVAMLQVFQLPPGKGAAWLAAMMEELRRHRPGPPPAGVSPDLGAGESPLRLLHQDPARHL